MGLLVEDRRRVDNKMKKSLISLLIISVALLSLLLAGCSKSAATTGQIFEVTRGDLNINVSSDGHLTMPDEYNLRFGTNGQVQQIFVAVSYTHLTLPTILRV